MKGIRKVSQLLVSLVSLLSLVHSDETGAFTLVGWQESVDPDATLTNLAAIADQHVHIEGDRIYVPSLNRLVAEYAAQADGSYHAQLQSPSLRANMLLDIGVIEQAGYPTGASAFQPHLASPIPLDINEGVEALINKPADAAVVGTVLAWLADGPLTPVVGEIYTVRVTASITSILTQWVNGALTFSQTLPAGRYAIVGANFTEDGGDLIAFRLVIPGYEWRPGGLAVGTFGDKPHASQRYGGMGVWGEFDHTTPPTLDVIAFAAAAQTIVGYLDLIKVA